MSGKQRKLLGRQPMAVGGVRVQKQDMRSQSQIRHPLFMREGLQGRLSPSPGHWQPGDSVRKNLCPTHHGAPWTATPPCPDSHAISLGWTCTQEHPRLGEHVDIPVTSTQMFPTPSFPSICCLSIFLGQESRQWQTLPRERWTVRWDVKSEKKFRTTACSLGRGPHIPESPSEEPKVPLPCQPVHLYLLFF